MSILSEVKTVLDELSVPVQTGTFDGVVPDSYVVIIPLTDYFELHADNVPGYDTQEARLSLYSKGNYIQLKNSIVRVLLKTGFSVTDRRYVEYENDTGYHHYAIDVAKTYEMEGN